MCFSVKLSWYRSWSILTLFNIPDLNTTRLIRLNRVNTITNFTFSIRGVGGFVYAQAGVATGITQEFAVGNSSRDAYVLVYRGSDLVSRGDKTIVFEVIGKA